MRAEIDFTEGSIGRKLLAFALPLFLGNLFQQLYNAADSLIVGNFLGREALAAVSSSAPIIFMLVGFFNGLAAGAGVVISRAYGAKDSERLQRAIHTDAAFGVVAGIALTIFAVLFTPVILRLISTPEEIMRESIVYFRIYSAGIFFSVMYNILMGIMNAVGDSRHPLYYLVFASLLNIVLDIILIGGFGMGVGAAAAATIISQALSSAMCFLRLIRSPFPIGIRIASMRIHRQELRNIVRFGFPAGFQNSIIGLANTIVQASINMFPAAVIAGAGVYGRIEGFILLPINKWNEKYQRVFLGGLTCDSQDYYNADAHANAIFLPKIENREDPLYIGFFHTGAYQESISGYGGIQHCLQPAPKHIIIDKDEDGEYYTKLFSKEQTYKSMLKILGY